jgi:hypothetical protein
MEWTCRRLLAVFSFRVASARSRTACSIRYPFRVFGESSSSYSGAQEKGGRANAQGSGARVGLAAIDAGSVYPFGDVIGGEVLKERTVLIEEREEASGDRATYPKG